MLLALKLNEGTKNAIQRSTCITFSDMEKMDAMSIDQQIEKNKNIKLSYPKENDRRVQGRGSIYMAKNRFISYTPESLDAALECIN